MNEYIKISPPLGEKDVRTLRVGQRVSISGSIYTARDAAHKLLVDSLTRGEKLPIDLVGQLIYYVGPTPSRPGRTAGAAGPTTSYRMDPYTPRLLEVGLRGMIGKGTRSPEVIAAMEKFGAVYFVAVGGAGALLAKSIKQIEIVAYPELGPEAIHRLYVKDFPVIVGIDTGGGNIYDEGD